MNAHEHKCYSDKVEQKKIAWKTFFTHTHLTRESPKLFCLSFTI